MIEVTKVPTIGTKAPYSSLPGCHCEDHKKLNPNCLKLGIDSITREVMIPIRIANTKKATILTK